MRILFAHNTYKQVGGEDSALSSERLLLNSRQHHTELFDISNNSINSLFSRFKTAFNCIYSRHSKIFFHDKLKEFSPDVVHVHNFFPILTPSVFDACIEARIPVVQTLHNFRTICPGALLLRSGQICKKCISGSPYQAVLYRCYRNSILGSFAVARMVSYHRKNRTWLDKIDRFIALTNFSKNIFIEAGFPEHKVVVKPNFYNKPKTNKKQKSEIGNGALFVGRLSEEKGLKTMLSAWKTLDIPLRIVGDGPLFEECKAKNHSSVVFLGQLNSIEVSEIMHSAAFLIMPSECYETFGMVIIESFAHGLPVLASKTGAMSEIVKDRVTGLHFEPKNPRDLAEKVLWMHNNPEACREMGENAFAEYNKKYTPERNYEILMNIYQQAIEEKDSAK